MNKKLQTIKYILCDFIASAIAWSSLYAYRKIAIEPEKYGYKIPVDLEENLLFGVFLIPVFWILLHSLTGSYKNIYRKSRIKELGQVLYITLIGSIVLFFLLLLDDVVYSYHAYYKTFLTLFSLQFTITSLFRLILTSITQHKIKNKTIGFNTIIVGSDRNAINLYNDLNNSHESFGYKFVGFVHVMEEKEQLLNAHLPHLGHFTNLPEIKQQYKVEEVIIAIETSEHNKIYNIINTLKDNGVGIKIIPDIYDIMIGSVRMNQILGTPLIEALPELMPLWQKILKRIIDVVLSVFVLLFLFPFLLIIAIGVKLSSPGPVIYNHSRIGRHKKPFNIFKFRTMYNNSEPHGPALSSENDKRITRFGKFLRKTRLDELPQFYNVLIGNMSVVGPRPERQYFIDQIVKAAPHYHHLQKVRPGITSWGQVKYGYAENVEQMVKRLQYDLLYIENMSLAVDFRIMIYTVLIIFQGRGK